MAARKAAFEILQKVFEDKAYSNIAVNAYFNRRPADDRDKALAVNIVYGVLTNLFYLDYQIKSYSNIPLKKISPSVLNILRISLYQIRFLSRVPDSAAVNEGVKLTKKVSYKSSGFVNAVLRASVRGGEKLPPKYNRLEYLSVLYSYPEWMIELWDRDLGCAECEKLLEAGNIIPPVTVRTNELKITPEKLAEMLGAEECEPRGALRLQKSGNIEQMPQFREGLFTVQDAAAQMAVLELDPQEGEEILDMCAAPGGKTTHISERMKDTGQVIAWDKYSQKIALIEENAARLGITNIRAFEYDATVPNSELSQKFDRVLLDAPCSGLGIIRKKPDIKWLRKKEDIAPILSEQKALLDAASMYVKKGGVLLYSTCTVNRAENEDMIDGFVSSHPEFAKCEEFINLYPHKNNTDGFFICKLRRNI